MARRKIMPNKCGFQVTIWVSHVKRFCAFFSTLPYQGQATPEITEDDFSELSDEEQDSD